MSPLERRCRLLLRAYPAPYRRDRGDEILGTLLDATPAGRGWPQLRDARSLAVAGLRERAAHNRQLTTAANIRTAALIGVTVYLAFSIAGYLSALLISELQTGQAELSPPPGDEFVVASLLAATAVLAWVSRRRVIVLIGALPAAAGVCYAAPWGTGLPGASVTLLVCLAGADECWRAARNGRPGDGSGWSVPSQPRRFCLSSAATGQPASCCWLLSPASASSGSCLTPGRPSRSR